MDYTLLFLCVACKLFLLKIRHFRWPFVATLDSYPLPHTKVYCSCYVCLFCNLPWLNLWNLQYMDTEVSAVLFWIFLLLFIKLASQRSPLCLLSGQSVISHSLKLEHQRFSLFLPKVHQFLKYKHLSDCHMHLVDFQSVEMVIFVNLIQIYSCFGDTMYANLLIQSWLEVSPLTEKFLLDWCSCEMALHISDSFSCEPFGGFFRDYSFGPLQLQWYGLCIFLLHLLSPHLVWFSNGPLHINSWYSGPIILPGSPLW